MIKLTITEKGGEPRALSFDKDEISIGRVSGNDIVLPKGNVSKRHSRIVQRDGRLEVSDLKSTNGTYVNGRKIADPMQVSSADKIYVGDFMIVLEGEPAEITASPGNGHNEAVVSGARKMPVPPPPPPPRSTSSLARLPADDDDEIGGDDEEDLPLAVRPPGAGRMPPPPPPSRRTPLASAAEALDEDAFSATDRRGALTDSSPPHANDDLDDDGASGGPALFERSPTRAADVEDDANDFRESPVTANRHPGDLLAAMGAPETGALSGRPSSAPLGRPAAEPGSAPTFDRGGSKVVPVAAVGADGTESPALEALMALMTDSAVSAIYLLGPETTLVERAGKVEPHPTSLGDANSVADAVWRLATTAIPPPPPDNPVIDVRLADGTRVAAAFPPAAPAGLCAAIRKPQLPTSRTFADLGPSGTMTKDIQSLLEAAVAGQRNLLVTGDGPAVAVVLGAVAAAIAPERRVVAIACAASRGRTGWTELAPGADMPALIRVAAAFRADYLVVGETAGGEVIDILTAAARGQDGIAFGLPARSAAEALARVEALAARGGGVAGVARLADSTLDLVVHAVSLPEGGVLITEIVEPQLVAGDKLGSEPVSVWRADGDGGKRGSAGKQQVTGVSARLAAALAASGNALPSGLLKNK